MIRDLKSYAKTVAKRLYNAFAVEEFDTETELEFWSLAAEHASRKEIPKFIDIVQWLDLLYEAPIHFIYKEEEENKLSLYRRQILVENIKNITGSTEGELTEKQQQQVREYEQQLENMEKRIPWDDQFLGIGRSSHSIGKCEHIPIYDGEKFWGIYCAGPHVTSPPSIKAKLSIVARMLSNWIIELDSTREKPSQNYEEKAEKVASDLGTGTLNIDRIASLMLGYLASMQSAAFGGIVELTKGKPEFLANQQLDEEFIDWFTSNISADEKLDEIKQKIRSEQPDFSEDKVAEIKFMELETEYSRAVIFLGLSGPSGLKREVESRISDTLNDLLVYRRQNLEITNKLIDTYYHMLRELEKQKERTCYHTPRMIGFSKHFGNSFGLDPTEQEQLQLTARLHDVGYIITQQLDDRMTVGAELEHPFIGAMIVEALPLHSDVKEGIKTHHEWINGSGMPQGLEGEDIPWTGKIIGLLEFVNEFVETHQRDDSKSDEEWIKTLSEEIIERADSQFDMVLVPTAIEVIESLGWKQCCTLGSDKEG